MLRVHPSGELEASKESAPRHMARQALLPATIAFLGIVVITTVIALWVS